MIKQEIFYIGNKQFIHTYSDENRFVIRDGIEYIEADDWAEFNYQYTEGDLIPIEEENNEEFSITQS